MSYYHEAPGLTADWLNGWLAAIGIAVLMDDVKLAWSADAVPHALFEVSSAGFLERLAVCLPTEQTLADSTIARSLPETQHVFARNVTIESFRERAAIERSRGGGLLAASVTDLRAKADPNSLDHGAFDPGAPRGETLWSRARACARALPPSERRPAVAATLEGNGVRHQLNGLGFDARRLPAGVHSSGASSKVHADPVVELLCLAALQLFPTRGNGRRVRQRGWLEGSSKRGAFEWWAWTPYLDQWGIDALLDMPERSRRQFVIERYGVVPLQQPRGSADPTRAYFGERLS